MNIASAGFSIAVVVFLAGCAASPKAPITEASRQEAVGKATKVEHDSFSKVTVYRGPVISNREGGTGEGIVEEVSLRASKKADKTTVGILVVDYLSRGPRRYSSAIDDEGTSLRVMRIRFEPGMGSSVYEHLGIDLPDGYLERRTESGFKIRIYSASGQETFAIPAWYAKGFLNALSTK